MTLSDQMTLKNRSYIRYFWLLFLISGCSQFQPF